MRQTAIPAAKSVCAAVWPAPAAPSPDGNDWIDLSGAATLIDASPATIHVWAKNGLIKTLETPDQTRTAEHPEGKMKIRAVWKTDVLRLQQRRSRTGSPYVPDEDDIIRLLESQELAPVDGIGYELAAMPMPDGGIGMPSARALVRVRTPFVMADGDMIDLYCVSLYENPQSTGEVTRELVITDFGETLGHSWVCGDIEDQVTQEQQCLMIETLDPYRYIIQPPYTSSGRGAFELRCKPADAAASLTKMAAACAAVSERLHSRRQAELARRANEALAAGGALSQ